MHQKKLKFVSWLLMSMLCMMSYAQDKIQGTVKDTNGEPMIGVSVLVKGTKTGVITDFDGNFSLPSVDKSAVLVFTYVGYVTKEVKVNGQKHLDVIMNEDTKVLDEVVVIGYGTVNKRDLTGSVASVKGEDLAAVPVTSVSEALTGKLAGVSVTTTDGSPDGDVNIRIRGGGSLSQDNSPLYIVDGFPVSSIGDISPSEIESVDVLKDASSTAIYGARGANGVVIITTKSGTEGKTKVDFGASYAFKQATKLTKVLSPYDFVYYNYEVNGEGNFGVFEDFDIYKSIAGTDYQDEIFGRTGNQLQYNVNISGGTKQLKYNINYSHNDEESIMLGSGYRKDNINAKINSELNKWISIDFQARLSNAVTDGLGSGSDTNESNATNSIVTNAVRFRPVQYLNASDDNSDDTDEGSSAQTATPLERLLATYKQKRSFRQNYNIGVNWKPFKNITVRSEFGYGWRMDDTNQAWGSDATRNSNLAYNGQPQAAIISDDTRNWRNANTITYDNKKLFNGRDRLNILLGHEVSSSQEKAVTNTYVNFPSQMEPSEVLAQIDTGELYAAESDIAAKETMLSFFGRVNYTLKDKYLFTVTARADGSSKFAENNRWGFFPSAAFAWRISDEPFMQSTANWLSSLKLRLSYGTAGNNRISSGLISTTYTISGTSGKYPYFGEDRTAMLEHGTYLYNPDLKWETTITRNFGIDYGFWGNRISGTLDFYWNTTRDLLMRTEVPSMSGYNYQYQNFGQTSNKGVELTLKAILADTKKFGINFNFNIAYNKNNIDKLNNQNSWQSSNWGGSIISQYEDFYIHEGGSLGEIWGYKTNGFYTAYDPVTNPAGELILADDGRTWTLKDGVKDNSAALTGGSYYPGGLKVECDENGNPVKQKLGNTIAPVVGGFGFDGHAGNFDFSVFMNYSIGNKLINGTKLATSFNAGSSGAYNLNEDFKLSNRYTWIDPENGLNLGKINSSTTIEQYGGEQGLINRLNELNANANIWNPAGVTTMQLIDYAVEDASFLRLNNITVGYTLPKTWIKKWFMENVRIYFTGYNLWVFTNYSGTDPEVDTSSKRNLMTPGVDYAAYPKSRSFVGGINVTF